MKTPALRFDFDVAQLLILSAIAYAAFKIYQTAQNYNGTTQTPFAFLFGGNTAAQNQVVTDSLTNGSNPLVQGGFGSDII